MPKKIIFQTRQRIFDLIDVGSSPEGLRKFRKSRYMKQYLPEYMKQKKRFNLVLEIKDFNRIKTHAARCGLTPTAFLRESVLAYLDNTRIPSATEKQSLSELVFLLRNLSNNINQIARHCNTYQKLTLGNFLQTKKLLSELEEAAETIAKSS